MGLIREWCSRHVRRNVGSSFHLTTFWRARLLKNTALTTPYLANDINFASVRANCCNVSSFGRLMRSDLRP